ncbi:hypothetical protein [Leminorella richardii]|uniref:hypothetical protein n=1 Tax=Leminorella richardii TaxID=158841 RepID=UPI000DBE21B4|nr:hypothetical protein [Leminorella richardii]
MNALVKYAAPGVMIVLLGLALWWTFGQMKSLAVRLEQTESELSTERASGEALRRQYTRIQEVLDDVAKKKSESDREAGRLRAELDEAQRTVPCASQRVPDAVTERLRDRVSSVNAATGAQ